MAKTPRLKSDFVTALVERGFVQDVTDLEGIDAKAAGGKLVAYIGFDATAPSLHVGSLVQIMMLRWLQKTGNKPIVLVGGGTTKIGDPSGKDESRLLLDAETIDKNLHSLAGVFAQFVTFGDGATDGLMVNNADWLDGLALIPFLRDIGRHFSVNRMLAYESVKLRLEREQPLSFTEFNYMILQAYDFLELYRRETCTLQMGGSDQWGNILNGIELARRVEGAQLHGLTTPLITTADGAKMGKTARGAVWLNADMLSAYEYWQFWRNTQDADVGRFLRLFTELPLDEIARLEALQGQEINDAKKILANEATALCHGEDAAKDAAMTAQKTFEEGGSGEALPSVEIDADKLRPCIGVVDLFVESGLVKSKGEARRLIRQGGARVDGSVVSDEEVVFEYEDFDDGQDVKLSAGKKRHVIVRLKD